jgi:hypothetical protein
MSFIRRLLPTPYVADLAAPLLRLSPKDSFTVDNAVQGVLGLGGTGSGKTSTTAEYLSRSYLSAGMGGLVLNAVPGEADLWRRRCAATGRAKDLIVFDASGQHRFNFLQYMMETMPNAGELVMNVVALLSTVIDAANGRVGQGGGENAFWQMATKEALGHSLSVLWAAYGHINLHDLFALIQSRPTSYDHAASATWLDHSFMAHTLRQADEQPRHRMHPMDYRASFHYLTQTLANPDPRTTGNLIATISANLAPLTQGKMRELFCTGTTLVPEMTHEGAIIVLDLPAMIYQEAGILAQLIFKTLWQKAAQRRRVSGRTRPIFLFSDEFQYFLTAEDARFQSTARGQRVASVYLTQNLPGLYDRISSARPENSTDALIGNLQTKIFHANSCVRTNQWAADMISKGVQLRYSGGVNQSFNAGRSYGGNTSWSQSGNSSQGGSSGGGSNWGFNQGFSSGENAGYSEQIDYLVQPGYFTRLRKGGKATRYKVDALVFQGGRVFGHSRQTFLPVVLRQR